MDDRIPNKIIGYLLLIAGLFIIAYSAMNVWDTFKGNSQPYPLFSFEAIALDFSNMVEGAPANAGLRQELISSGLLNQPMNFAAHLLLMGFLASVGFKVASIGIMLVRTIKVNVKEEKDTILKPGWK